MSWKGLVFPQHPCLLLPLCLLVDLHFHTICHDIYSALHQSRSHGTSQSEDDSSGTVNQHESSSLSVRTCLMFPQQFWSLVTAEGRKHNLCLGPKSFIGLCGKLWFGLILLCGLSVRRTSPTLRMLFCRKVNTSFSGPSTWAPRCTTLGMSPNFSVPHPLSVNGKNDSPGPLWRLFKTTFPLFFTVTHNVLSIKDVNNSEGKNCIYPNLKPEFSLLWILPFQKPLTALWEGFWAGS